MPIRWTIINLHVVLIKPLRDGEEAWLLFVELNDAAAVAYPVLMAAANVKINEFDDVQRMIKM